MSADAANGRAVDFHAHLGKPDPKAPPFLRDLFDWEGYLEKQAAAGIGRTVLSYALDAAEGTPEEELDRARGEHEFLAGLVRDHGDTLSALVAVDPFGGAGWLEEARARLAEGFAGVCLPTSREGRYLDAPEAQDALALADEHAALVFIHPSDIPVSLDRTGDSLLGAWIGRPMDTSVCLSRLLLAGTLARYPRVRVLVAHCGGALPMLLGRLDQVHEGLARRARVMKKGGGGPPGGGGGPPPGFFAKPAEGCELEAELDGELPSRRLDRLWFDTASFHPAAVQAAIATVGSERTVLGTDYPPAGDGPAKGIETVVAAVADAADRDRILHGNAAELLGSP